MFSFPLWLASLFCTNQVSLPISGISGCNHPSALKLKKSLLDIFTYQVDYTIYTNRSASARNGRAAVIKGRSFTSSNKAEFATVESALQWIYTNANPVHTSIIIFTDSQSLCEVLSSCNPWTTSSKHILHFVKRLHPMGTRKLQHFWQWPCKQSSKRSHHSCIRYHPLYTNVICLSGCWWIFPWRSSFPRPNKQNLPTSKVFYQLAITTKP